MPITVRLFAILRERAGRDETTVPHADGMTVADAILHLVADGLLATDVPTDSFLCAVNHEYASRDTRLADGDELALIPPVSGG